VWGLVKSCSQVHIDRERVTEVGIVKSQSN
jgi:hypothetical protein